MRVNEALCQMLGLHLRGAARSSPSSSSPTPTTSRPTCTSSSRLVAGRDHELPHAQALPARRRPPRLGRACPWRLVRNDAGQAARTSSPTWPTSPRRSGRGRTHRADQPRAERAEGPARAVQRRPRVLRDARQPRPPGAADHGPRLHRGACEAMYGDQLDDRANDWIGRADKAAARMSELVNSLLEFSRAGAGDADHRALVSVPDLRRRRCCQDLEQLISETGATVEVAPTTSRRCSRTGPAAPGPQNLVQNALKYRAPDRTPALRGRRRGARDRLAGHRRPTTPSAYPEDQREQIFSMFSRARRQRRRATASAWRPAARSSSATAARIWVEDNPAGPGSRFCFTLPR